MRYLTSGESHGPQLDVILDGFPANFNLDMDRINKDLALRQIKIGSGERQSIETDVVIVNGGIMEEKTTGSPLSFTIVNKNHDSWKGKNVDAFTIPRPGHGDKAGVFKYNLNDIRKVLERTSARGTATQVVVGSCCMQVLEKLGIKVSTEIISVGQLSMKDSDKKDDFSQFIKLVESCKNAGETIGGTLKTTVKGLLPGLGSYSQYDRKLDAKLAASVISIPAIKGVEFGAGFGLTLMYGTEAQKHLGGFTSGMTDGNIIEILSAMKPIPTTITPQDSIDLVTKKKCKTKYERSDFAPIFRTPIIVSSVVAYTILNEIIETFGGDTFEELLDRYSKRQDQLKGIDSEYYAYNVTNKKKVFWK